MVVRSTFGPFCASAASTHGCAHAHALQTCSKVNSHDALTALDSSQVFSFMLHSWHATLAMTKGYTHMSPEQITMSKRWRAEGASLPDIAKLLQRSAGTIHKHITKGNVKTKPKGHVDVISGSICSSCCL